jgi:hypothetical protein
MVSEMPRDLKSNSTFNAKLFELLDRIEYRRIESSEDMEDVARIRHKAYSVNNLIRLNGSLLIDEIDFDPNSFVYGVYVDEKLVSTLRINLVTPDHRVSLSRKIFPKEIDAFLDAGMTIIDPTRLAADPDIVRTMPGIPYLTIRMACLASEYFNADRVLQAVDIGHAAFYQKLFFADVLAGPLSKNENYNVNLMLMSIRGKEMLPKIYERFPAFNSDSFERRLMFGPDEARSVFPLSIRPTARRVLEAGANAGRLKAN